MRIAEDGGEPGCLAEAHRVAIAGGTLHTGAGDWEASGRIEAHDAVIAPFDIDDIEITEAAYQACTRAGACAAVPLSGEPGRALSGITRDEARAYCAFHEGRLPTEDEWTWVCGGTKARRYAWGDTGAVCRRAAFGLEQGPCGYGGVGPELAGTHPDGDSPEKIHDLAGNVAEWVDGKGDGAEGRIRGGSWQSELATELRSWQAQPQDPNARSPAVGARCAYDRK
jgi:formylglycine-generating enzyme required for sulfatase activity